MFASGSTLLRNWQESLACSPSQADSSRNLPCSREAVGAEVRGSRAMPRLWLPTRLPNAQASRSRIAILSPRAGIPFTTIGLDSYGCVDRAGQPASRTPRSISALTRLA